MNRFSIITLAALSLTACAGKQEYDATGMFETTTIEVSAETTGKIMMLNLSEGDNIKQGAEVGLIDTTLLHLQYRQTGSRQTSTSKSAPDIAKQVASLKAEIAHQENECARITRLLADGAATRKQSDDAIARLNILRRQLEGLISSLGKSRSSISDGALALQYQKDQIEEQILRSRIKSPVTGTILEKYVEQGEYVGTGRPLFKIANLNDMYLRCYFTASQLAHVKLGQKVRVTADFGGDEQYEYEGKITWIAQESEFTPKSIQTRDTRANLVYAVKVAVKNDGRLKIGQYGGVNL